MKLKMHLQVEKKLHYELIILLKNIQEVYFCELIMDIISCTIYMYIHDYTLITHSILSYCA